MVGDDTLEELPIVTHCKGSFLNYIPMVRDDYQILLIIIGITANDHPSSVICSIEDILVQGKSYPLGLWDTDGQSAFNVVIINLLLISRSFLSLIF